MLVARSSKGLGIVVPDMIVDIVGKFGLSHARPYDGLASMVSPSSHCARTAATTASI